MPVGGKNGEIGEKSRKKQMDEYFGVVLKRKKKGE